MTTDELFIKNQTIGHEFSLHFLEHLELAEQIPAAAQIILLLKNDLDLYRENMKLADVQKVPIVYVHIKEIQPARSRLVHQEIEMVSQ